MAKIKNILKEARVLYVEDEEDIRDEIVYFLKSRVKELRVATDGVDGLEQLNTNEIDLIVTDIMMPKMDGLEMIKNIRQEDSEIPIIITSAYNDASFLDKAINLRVDGYVMKPLDLMLFYETLKKAYEPIVLRKNLKKSNLELNELNITLEMRIRDEVAKNREKDRQLLHKAKLAQMGEMLGMIAHQWRQPLNAIATSIAKLELQVILEQYDKNLFAQNLANITRVIEHLNTTIEDFRNFFKMDKDKQKISYEELVDDVFNIIKVSVENRGIKLETDFRCNLKFYTYSNELEHVILNLIKNAEDILLEREVENPLIKIATYFQDKTYILEISDNGGGVPNQIIDKIFDPYFSTKKSKDGTGIGLNMSKTIIEEHCGGKLTIFNNDLGAVFKIEMMEESYPLPDT